MPTAARTFRPRHRDTPHQDRRGTTTQRGYGTDWQRLRAAYIAEQPVCEACQRRASEDVDHIRPFRGHDDPRRMQWHNLQALCRACHNAKTRRQ